MNLVLCGKQFNVDEIFAEVLKTMSQDSKMETLLENYGFDEGDPRCKKSMSIRQCERANDNTLVLNIQCDFDDEENVKKIMETILAAHYPDSVDGQSFTGRSCVTCLTDVTLQKIAANF